MVVVANHPRREYVEGPVFNVSSRRFETVDTIARALVAEYHMKYVDSGFFIVLGEYLAIGSNRLASVDLLE